MKAALALLSLLIATSAYSLEDNFSVLKGKFHRGGKLQVNIDDNQSTATSMFANIEYELYTKRLVPVPNKYLKGTYKQELPKMFENEAGFIELENLGEIKLEDASLVHMGRVDYKEYSNCHHIEIRPFNNKSLMRVYYHRSAPKTGWVRLYMIIFDIPVLGDYSLTGIRSE